MIRIKSKLVVLAYIILFDLTSAYLSNHSPHSNQVFFAKLILLSGLFHILFTMSLPWFEKFLVLSNDLGPSQMLPPERDLPWPPHLKQLSLPSLPQSLLSPYSSLIIIVLITVWKFLVQLFGYVFLSWKVIYIREITFYDFLPHPVPTVRHTVTTQWMPLNTSK